MCLSRARSRVCSEEHASQQMQPQLSHYRKWAAARAPGKDPAEYLKSKRSIHVPFLHGRDDADAARTCYRSTGLQNVSHLAHAESQRLLFCIGKMNGTNDIR